MSRRQVKKITGAVGRRKLAMVIARDGDRCFFCRRVVPVEERVMHRLIPRGKGGTNDLSNLVMVCPKDRDGRQGLDEHALVPLPNAYYFSTEEMLEYAENLGRL